MRRSPRIFTAWKVTSLIAAVAASCALPAYQIQDTAGTGGAGTTSGVGGSGAHGGGGGSDSASTTSGSAGGDGSGGAGGAGTTSTSASGGSGGGMGGSGGSGGGGGPSCDPGPLIECPPNAPGMPCPCVGATCYINGCGDSTPYAKKLVCNDGLAWEATAFMQCCKGTPVPCDSATGEVCVLTTDMQMNTSSACLHNHCFDNGMPLKCACAGVCDGGLTCSLDATMEVVVCGP